MGRGRFASGTDANWKILKLVGQTRLGIFRLCREAEKGIGGRGDWLANAEAPLRLCLYPGRGRRDRDYAGQDCDRSKISIFVTCQYALLPWLSYNRQIVV